jgi:Ca2+-binding EF-hand superfamily protein
MRKQFQFSLTLLQYGKRLLVGCLIGGSIVASAQETRVVTAVFDRRVDHGISTGGGAGGAFFVNGGDIGTILLKTCDLNADGMVTSAELKEVASASFKLWDTNADSNLTQLELSTALKEFFPVPPQGGVHAVRVINGVAVEVPPGDLPTPDGQLAKHTFAGADSNTDGLISSQELSEFLDKRFSQWDRDGNGSLNTEELNGAFFELSRPDQP